MAETFYGKLAKIQAELNAPKGQYNSFGGYHYRSCEDILNAVKPLLDGLFLSISDEVVQLGDRYYIKATATITDGKHSHTASALAREALTKKGMDDAQVTGSTSSYARKYCLNGLFGIDDAKDPDTDEHANQTRGGQQQNGGQRQQNNRGGQQRQQQAANQTNAQQQRQQQPQKSPDEILRGFTEAAQNAATLADLARYFAAVQKKLKGQKEHLAKATEVKDLRKSELSNQQAAA